MDDMILFQDLRRELKLSSGTMEYHIDIGGIPNPERWGSNRFYRPAEAQVIRAYFTGRIKFQHRPRAVNPAE